MPADYCGHVLFFLLLVLLLLMAFQESILETKVCLSDHIRTATISGENEEAVEQ